MIGSTSQDIQAVRNDKIIIREIEDLDPSHLVSPLGPGYPGDTGIMEDAARQLENRASILGVCLGHQGICEALGGIISHVKRLIHGKQSRTKLDSRSSLSKGPSSKIQVARYHSLVAQPGNLPGELEATVRDRKASEIMAVQHRKYHVHGLQSYLEFIPTSDGNKILENFLSIT